MHRLLQHMPTHFGTHVCTHVDTHVCSHTGVHAHGTHTCMETSTHMSTPQGGAQLDSFVKKMNSPSPVRAITI